STSRPAPTLATSAPLTGAANATAATTTVPGAAVAADPSVAGERPRMTDTPIQITELATGLRVVTERMPEARSATLGIWVGVGARDEPPELAGASHFLEHLLFKGT